MQSFNNFLIVVFGAIVVCGAVVYLKGMKHATLDKKLTELESHGLKFDHVLKGKDAYLAFDIKVEKIVIFSARGYVQYNLNQIRQWQLYQQSHRNPLTNGDTVIDTINLTFSDPSNPLVKIETPNGQGDSWIAKISAIVNK